MTDLNLIAQTNDRMAQVSQELYDIALENEPKTIRTPNGDLNHEKWLKAEAKAIEQERARYLDTITVRNAARDY